MPFSTCFFNLQVISSKDPSLTVARYWKKQEYPAVKKPIKLRDPSLLERFYWGVKCIRTKQLNQQCQLITGG